MSGSRRRIERAVIEGLTTSGPERFNVAAHRMGAVKVALQASMQSGGAEDELRRLLRLIVALDSRLESPQAAEHLRALLRNDPDAMTVIQARIVPQERLEEVRRFAEEQGRLHRALHTALSASRTASSAKARRVALTGVESQSPVP